MTGYGKSALLSAALLCSAAAAEKRLTELCEKAEVNPDSYDNSCF